VKTQQSEDNNKTFRGAVQRDSNVVGERFWRDFSSFFFPLSARGPTRRRNSTGLAELWGGWPIEPEKGGEVAEKGGTPEMDVVGVDIMCVRVFVTLKTLTIDQGIRDTGG
jgi:hypothetical protein